MAHMIEKALVAWSGHEQRRELIEGRQAYSARFRLGLGLCSDQCILEI